MRSHQALSHADIAKVLNISTRTVKRKWAQSPRRLGEQIKGEMGW
jgi:DNA-directed RNA polymerase specialized sigma24 family protein